MPMMGFNPWDPQRLNAAVSQEGNRLNFLNNQQSNLLNRLSAYERNYVDHDLGIRNARANQTQADAARDRAANDFTIGRLNDQTNRYNIDTTDATNRYGINTTDATNRYQIDTGRYNLLDQIASNNRNSDIGAQVDYLTNMNNANANVFGANRAAQASEYGAGLNYQSNLLNSLADLAGTRHASDRSMQSQLGSANMAAQANMLGPMLQQQRFATIAPLVGQVLGGLV